MTSATMIFGMLPLALKLEPGAETRAPMAVVVIGALLSSTVLTLVVVPALYTVMDDLQTHLFRRGKQVAAKVPAVSAAIEADGAAAPEHGDAPRHGTPSGAQVPVNIADRGSGYIVRAALPGVKLEDVDVSMTGHTLSIRNRQPENGAAKYHEDGRWLVHEHSPQHWERTLNLPHEVDGSAVTARYTDGILELWLPKARPDAQRKIPVRSGGD
jgi:HSP20 family molecular chaperone IbpA